MLSQSVFTLGDFHRMTADADICDLVAMLFGAGIYMTRALHLHALLDVQRFVRLLQSVAYQPGDGATGRRSGSRIFTEGIKAPSAQADLFIASIILHL